VASVRHIQNAWQVGLCAKVLTEFNPDPSPFGFSAVKHPLRGLFVDPPELLKVLCREIPALYPRLPISALFAQNAVII
jgi:hypothetical protein